MIGVDWERVREINVLEAQLSDDIYTFSHIDRKVFFYSFEHQEKLSNFLKNVALTFLLLQIYLHYFFTKFFWVSHLFLLKILRIFSHEYITREIYIDNQFMWAYFYWIFKWMQNWTFIYLNRNEGQMKHQCSSKHFICHSVHFEELHLSFNALQNTSFVIQYTYSIVFHWLKLLFRYVF